MRKLNLFSEDHCRFLQIPVEFIDKYMASAPDSALKVYLYLQRSLMDASILLSVEELSSLFDITPNTVVRVLKYWEAQKLLKIKYVGEEISDLTLLPFGVTNAATEEVKPVSDSRSAEHLTVVEPESDGPYDISELDENQEFSELLELVEYYLKKPLNNSQRKNLGISYLALNKRLDLAEYLVEYCIDMEKPRTNYMEAVALGWKKEGLTEIALKELKAEMRVRNRYYSAVRKGLGIQSRALVKEEEAYIKSWSKMFDLSYIEEACKRCVMQTGAGNFKYVDKILMEWKEKGVCSEADILKLDEEHKKKSETKKQKNSSHADRKSYINYKERETDYDALAKKYYES